MLVHAYTLFSSLNQVITIHFTLADYCLACKFQNFMKMPKMQLEYRNNTKNYLQYIENT